MRLPGSTHTAEGPTRRELRLTRHDIRAISSVVLRAEFQLDDHLRNRPTLSRNLMDVRRSLADRSARPSGAIIRGAVYFARRGDSVTMQYGSYGYLGTYMENRLEVGDADNPNISRVAYNVDPQVMPPQDFDLTGVEAIAGNEAARTEVDFLARRLSGLVPAHLQAGVLSARQTFGSSAV